MSSKIYLFVLVPIIIALTYTFAPAYAVQGPTVSTGSNPIRSWSRRLTGSNNGWNTFETFTDDFVLTDVTLSANNDCHLSLSNQNSSTAAAHIFSAYAGYNSPYVSNFSSGILIQAGTVVYIHTTVSSTCHYIITGYHTH